MSIDFGKTATDYAKHRQGFPPSFFDRMTQLGIGIPDQRILDLGTGAGTLALGFARGGATVTGLDPSSELLAEARRTAQDEGLDVKFVEGKAEQTGLDGESFDVVTAGQCWHWFRRAEAAAEIARVLRPNGRIVIGHFDWLPLDGNIVDATEKLIEAHNPSWSMGGGMGVHPQLLRDLGEAGYREIESMSYDMDAMYTPEAWRGRIRASAGVAASLEPPAVERFDRELTELLASRFPGGELAVPHRVFAVWARRPER